MRSRKSREIPPSKELTFEQANEICRGLIPIGERVLDFVSALNEGKFAAFVPWQDFLKSFARDGDELLKHQRFLTEYTKFSLASAPQARTQEQLDQLYVPPFLQQLLEEQDRRAGRRSRRFYRHIPGDEPISPPNLDPCIVRMNDLARHDKALYEHRLQTVRDAVRSQFISEVPLHASGLSSGYEMAFPPFASMVELSRDQLLKAAPARAASVLTDLMPWQADPRSRLAFFQSVMERDGGPLGFGFDSKKSRRNNPVFSKAVTDNWDLCFTIENTQLFFFSAGEGSLNLTLTLRSHSLRREPKQGQALPIRFESVVPLTVAYREFHSLDELETVIRANLFLYSLMASDVETAIRAVID